MFEWLTGLLRLHRLIGYIYRLLSKFYKSNDLQVFSTRSETDELMIELVSRAKAVDFIGISHSSLSDYLNKAFNENSKIKLKRVNVFFARKDDGELWEDSPYLTNVLTSIRNISRAFSYPDNYQKTSTDLNIYFYRMRHHSTFGCCCLDSETFFITNYLPGKNTDTKLAYTLYFTKNNPTKDSTFLFKKYTEALQAIKERSVLVGSHSPCLWDLSVQEWSDFVSNSNSYLNNMDLLISLAAIKDGDKILEVGCGTGELARKVIGIGKEIDFYIVDKSPEMIEFCNKTIDKRIKMRVFDVTDSQIDTEFHLGKGNSFDKIISHLTFPIPEEPIENFRSLIEFINKYLKRGGRFLLSIHNTAIKVEGDNYKPKEDFLRRAIRDNLEEMGLKKIYRQINREEYTADTFDHLFCKSYGYKKVLEKNERHSFTMTERLSMWKVPAVLNTLLNYQDLPEDKKLELFSRLSNKFSQGITEDIITKTFVYEKSN